MNNQSGDSFDIATLGGGCFWCIEAVFSELKGVVKAESGYSGGTVSNPSYEDVCTDETGHAEVVQVTFDPKLISYNEILHVFFSVHDPTTLNRQGADVGTQYRSVVFYHNETQKKIAEEVMSEMGKVWTNPLVTQLAPLDKFYRAEEYHQHYFKNNPSQGYCRVVIQPKLAKFRKRYQDKLN